VRRQLAAGVGRLLSPLECGEQGPDALWSEYLVAESAGIQWQGRNVAGDDAAGKDVLGGEGPVSGGGPGAPLARCGLAPPMLEVQGGLLGQRGAGGSRAGAPTASAGAGEAGKRLGVLGEGGGRGEERMGEVAWRQAGGRGARHAAVDDWLRVSVFLPLQRG